MEEHKGNRYINEFLNFKCTVDIITACFPVGNNPTKEISESMAVIKRLRKITIPNPMKYTLYDFCAGNALTSVTACFLLQVKKAYAIDNRERVRRFHTVKRFHYLFEDIYKFDPERIETDSIIIGVHACSNLANRVIEIYKESKAEYLILMPCCVGSITKTVPEAIHRLIKSKYVIWTWQLSESVKGRFNFDKNCISPKNGVIVASKPK